MPKVLLEMSVSLDGYVAGPDVSAEEPMGRGGEHLHEWLFEGRSAAESQAFETDHFSGIGALIIGRRMADLGIGPWGEEQAREAAGSLDVQVNGGADIGRQHLEAGALEELRVVRGGELAIISSPGHRTRVMATIPGREAQL
jgi:hypothetical protein